MSLKVFIIGNIPPDVKQSWLKNFIECFLDKDVKSIQFSSPSDCKKTALVTLDAQIDLRSARDTIKENEHELLDIAKDSSLTVNEPGLVDNLLIVVEKLKEDYMSLEDLKNYLQSVFADGNEVVCGAYTIHDSDRTVLRLNDPKIVLDILQKEDHLPLPSIDYHIQIKPFYRTFHGNLEQSHMMGIEEESVTLEISKVKWKLLKDKVETKDWKVDYDKGKEMLAIKGNKASNLKTTFVEYLRSIAVNSKILNSEDIEFLKRDQVKRCLKNFLTQEIKDVVYEIKSGCLSVYSLNKDFNVLDKIISRVLHQKSIRISEELFTKHFDDCTKFSNDYIIMTSWDDKNFELTLKGLVEDVTDAIKDVEQAMDKFKYYTKSFDIVGLQALYVNNYGLDTLEMKLEGFDWKSKVVDENNLSIEFTCKKCDVRNVKEKLNQFTESIKIEEVTLDDLSKEDLALVRQNIKKDTEFLKTFQSSNKCCVIIDDNEKSQETIFKISQFCKLHIKLSKNIIEEKADLLVCGVHASLDLNKTNVSKAFSKSDRALQADIKNYSFPPNGVLTVDRQMPTTKNIAVSFIIMNPYEKETSDQWLQAAVGCVLEDGNRKGVTSISFPPLGYGRAFKFPANTLAEQIITCIKNFVDANATNLKIKCINILAPEPDLYGIINEVASNTFHATFCEGPLKTVFVHTQGGGIASKFKKEVEDSFFHTEYQILEKTIYLSPKFQKEVFETAKKLGVSVKVCNDSDEMHIKLEIKGRIGNVARMRLETVEMMNLSKKSLQSETAPKRGTVEFIKYAKDCQEECPSYWKMKMSEPSRKVDVDENVLVAIGDMMQSTWIQNKVGLGNDARNIPQDVRIEVVKVERLENPKLFTNYYLKRKSIFIEMARRETLCAKVETIQNSKGPVETMSKLPSNMTSELYGEINEVYLLHGTKLGTVQAILKQGMDNRLSSSGGMFGQGVYLAESSTKSDQYTDSRDKRAEKGTDLTMILARVCLGDVFLCDHNHKSVESRGSIKLMKPPCKICLKDLCDCTYASDTFYHSVMGDGKWIFREFVLFDPCQCYPEYIITYRRV